MPPKSKRSRSNDNSSVNQNILQTTTVIPDLWRSHLLLAPNEYSWATIGTHNCLVRCCESENLARCFYQEPIIGLTAKDFKYRLNDFEKKLKDDCQLNIERCPMIARWRQYLETEESGKLFDEHLKEIERHLNECMREYDTVAGRCLERNQAAVGRNRAERMRRFQYYDYNEVNQPMNLINLKNWTQEDFQSLIMSINTDLSNCDEVIEELKILLNNSFFIIQHPSPHTVVLDRPKYDGITAKIDCRLLCLFDDKSNSKLIKINNITPIVCCLSTSNQIEENNVSYRQKEINWKIYSIVTAPNKNTKTFSCAEISEINFNEIRTENQRQQLSTGQRRYSPFLYCIDFHIQVTVHLPDGTELFQHDIVIRSAPFGAITNRCQEIDLFPELFLEDIKSWKSISMSSSTMVSNILTTSPVTINLTIEDIVDSIRRYFIHKTGIQPKHWVMPYIEQELRAVYNNDQNFMDHGFYGVLTKILAQINYMTEHPLLILFHNDGLFLGLCDSDWIGQILLEKNKRDGKAICAMRFGSIHHMTSAKNIGIRIDLADKSFKDIRYYTFDADKIPSQLGLFIIKIALCQASRFENILCDIIKIDPGHLKIVLNNMCIFSKLYDSPKLREICPHEKGYDSIWTNFYNKENKNLEDSNSTSIINLPQNLAMTTITDDNTNNNAYHSWNPTPCTIEQTQQAIQPQYLPPTPYSQIPQHVQYPPPQYYSQMPLQVQTSHTNYASYIPQNNDQYVNSAPIVIVMTPNNQLIMSNEDIIQFISNNLPQYSPFIQSDRIHQFCFNLPPQPVDIPTQTLENSLPDFQSSSSTSEESTTDGISIQDLLNSLGFNNLQSNQ